MDKPFLDGFSCSWSKQTLLRKPQDSSRMVLYGSVFCELHPHSSRDTQGACLHGQWPFCSLKCCKQLQKFHLLSALYLFFFLSHNCLLAAFTSKQLFLALFVRSSGLRDYLCTVTKQMRESISVSQQGKDRDVGSTLIRHQGLYTRESPWRHPRCRESFSVFTQSQDAKCHRWVANCASMVVVFMDILTLSQGNVYYSQSTWLYVYWHTVAHSFVMGLGQTYTHGIFKEKINPYLPSLKRLIIKL